MNVGSPSSHSSSDDVDTDIESSEQYCRIQPSDLCRAIVVLGP